MTEKGEEVEMEKKKTRAHVQLYYYARISYYYIGRRRMYLYYTHICGFKRYIYDVIIHPTEGRKQ